MKFCRARNQGRRCTRPLDHPGLHRHRAVMWTVSDPSACPGGVGIPAPELADGWPHGRALCPVCGRFVALDDAGRLLPHDADVVESDAEEARRQEWFNTHGW